MAGGVRPGGVQVGAELREGGHCGQLVSGQQSVPKRRQPSDGVVRVPLALREPCAELLFQVLTEREETNSITIASNESFSGWTKTFTDPRLCAAIVDRLTFGGNIIETGTTSYRLAHARAQRAGQAADR